MKMVMPHISLKENGILRRYLILGSISGTSIFVLFLLHLAKTSKPYISTWRPILKTDNTPWWFERKQEPVLNVAGLSFENITVEPSSITSIVPNNKISLTISGISPDVVLRLPCKNDKDLYIIIENKPFDNSNLTSKQRNEYIKAKEKLNQYGRCILLILHSVGCKGLFKSLIKMEMDNKPDIGLLLWEDVFRIIGESDFTLPGITFSNLNKFTKDAALDCKDW